MYGYLVFKQSEASALSPIFNIPSDTNVYSYLKCYAYGGSINGSYKPTVVIAASNSVSTSGASTTLKGKIGLPGASTTKRDPIGTNLTLSASAKRVSIYVSGRGSSVSVGGTTMGLICDDYSLTYR